jgi:branched-chain amino acid transport system permease protein
VKSWVWLIFALVSVVVFPLVISNPYYLNVANIIGLNAIIVVGLNLLIGFAGQISLGHAAFYGLGAYVAGILTVTYNFSPWLAMISAVILTTLVALVIGIPTLKLEGHYLVMATLGFNLIVNIVMIQWDKLTGGPSGFPGIPGLNIGSFVFDTDLRMYYFIWFVVVVTVILSINLVRSRVGRGLRALHSGEVAASSLGVRTDVYKIKIFLMSASFASLAGSIYAYYMSFVSPKTFDIFFSVELVSMVIVGGMGNIWGAIFGTAFLTSLPNVLHFFDEYKDIFYGLILVLILVFLPEGLAATFSKFGRRAVRFRFSSPTEVLNGTSSDRSATKLSKESQTIFLPKQTDEQDFTDEILSVNDVSVAFGGLLALNLVTFQIKRGSITALIGPNGAGKTTMINVISGLCTSNKGRIYFQGKEAIDRRPYRMATLGLARTFQNLQIFHNMSVLENVMVGFHARTKNEFLVSMLHTAGFSREEAYIKAQALEILHFFDLHEMAHLPAANLSYGDQKRVEMARAMATNPSLVLLDEPVAGLNMTETKEVARLIRRIRDQGVTVMLVEHDMNLVMGISDHVIVLNYGRMISEGSPQTIQRDRLVREAYLGGLC